MAETKTFGEWLRQHRKALDLTQKDLANRTGCSSETIRKLEAGHRKPSRQLVEQLADQLAVPEEQRPALLALARAGSDEGQAASPPPGPVHTPRPPATPPTKLPRPFTSFVGRHEEIHALSTLLRSPGVRLLTLTGEGGSGKTRLAIQVAAHVPNYFPDGVFFVSLAAIKDPGLVASTIAQALEVRETPGRSFIKSLKDYLRAKQILLLLDNFEQILEAAPLVDELLADAPKLKVLVTSRETLHLKGEHNHPVPPLRLPDHNHLKSLQELRSYEAVDLFVQRAMLAKPDFTLGEDDAPAIIEICKRVDGLPLAIELAAARIRVLPPQSMLSRIEKRLDLLKAGPRDVPTRQQTLRNTIEWSYDLLDEGEKQLFRRMAPFNGGRTVQSLQEVCNYDGQLLLDVSAGAQALVDQSLLKLRKGRIGELRFWMLEVIHEYARERLDESGESRELSRRHALYFMALAEEAEPHLRSAKQQQWLERLEDEHDNLRSALTWAKEMGRSYSRSYSMNGHAASTATEAVETGLRTAGAIWRFWLMKGYLSEGRERLVGLLQQAGRLGILRQESAVKAMNGAGYLAWRQGDSEVACSMLEQALEMGRELGYKKGVALALNNLGNVAYMEEEYDKARALYEESLAVSKQLGDKTGISASLHNLATVAQEQGNYATARSLYEEGLALSRELGDKWGIANALNNLGTVTSEQGDLAAARAEYEESLALKRVLGDKWGITALLNNLGNLASGQGDYAAARRLLVECLALKRELGHKWGIANTLNNLGHVAYMEGDYDEACALYKESLALSRELGETSGIVLSLAGIGAALVGRPDPGRDANRMPRGATLLGAVAGLLEETEAVLEREDRVPYERGVEIARTQLDNDAWQKAWSEGRAMSMEQAIAYALEWA